MSKRISHRRVRFSNSFTRISSIVVISVGVSVLAGWSLNYEFLKSIFTGFASMKPFTGVGFVLAGLSLWLLQKPTNQTSVRTSKVAYLLSFIVLSLGLINLLEYVFGWQPGIDQWLFREAVQQEGGLYPGRMPLTTAISFVLTGLALRILDARHAKLAQTPTLLVGLISLLAFTGYVYGVEALYQVSPYSSMALHTALTFLALFGGLLAARPEHGFLAATLGNEVGGNLARRLLPLIILLPLIYGWFGLQGQRAGYYGTEFGVALLALSSSITLAVIVWLTAESLNRSSRAQVQTEVELQRSEERFRNTLDSMLEGAQIIGFDWRYLYVNEMVANQGHQTKEGLLGHTMMEMYPGIENTELFKVLRSCMQERVPQQMENEFIYPDGAKGWFELNIHPVPEGIFILSMDISVRKRAEQVLQKASEELELQVKERTAALSEANALLQTLMDNMPDHIYFKDADSRFVRNSRSQAKMMGLGDPAQVVGRTDFDFFPKDHAQQSFTEEQEVIKSGRPLVNIEERVVWPDGHVTWVSTTKMPLRDAKGRVIGTFGISREITDRKQAEMALRASEERFRLIVEAAPSAMIVVDRDGKMNLVNALAQELFGYQRAELLGYPVEMLVPQRFRGSHTNYRQGFLNQPSNRSMGAGRDLLGLRKDGREVPIEIGLTPYESSEGILTIAQIVDISERKQAEEMQQKTNAQLEAANKELEAFSYSVSHDLRAPLRSIDGFSQALLEDYGDQIPQEGRNYLERARAAAQRMAELIDDMLALSRVTRAPMQPTQVDLSILAENIASELQRSEPKRRVKFSIAPGLVVGGDQNLLRIALQNLLANAWKFTSRKKDAHIEFGIQDGADGRTFFIRDNGSGFDMNYVDKLFGAFQRLHSTDEFPGTGIGLATVQRIFLKHGGRVWAEGAVDQGATFYFTL